MVFRIQTSQSTRWQWSQTDAIVLYFSANLTPSEQALVTWQNSFGVNLSNSVFMCI